MRADMSITRRLDGFQRRHRWVGFPIAVVYKYVDDQGNYLAALMTYYGFLSVFPLLLLLSSVLGLVLQGDPDLQQRILDSALGQFPVIGSQLGEPAGLHGSGLGVVVGALGVLYGALGVAQALQNAMNVMWAVPRNRRPNPLVSRLRSLLLLGTGGLALLGTTILSALGSSAGAYGASLGIGLKMAIVLLSVALNTAVFILAFRVGTAQPLRLREVAPGAVTAAVLWHGLQLIGTAFVGHVVKNASAVNGVFALVLGLIAWIFLGAVIVVLAVEINVVGTRRLYPRALLAPFTDNVVLTSADKRAYSGYAAAQRTKGFQSVDVRFRKDRGPDGRDEPDDTS
jgi:YihY family inner membrane protein